MISLPRASLALSLLCTFAFAGVATSRADEKDAAAVAPSPTQDEDPKTLYALGLAVARSLDVFSLTEKEVEHVLAGIKDAALKRTLKVDFDAFKPKLQALARKRASRLIDEEVDTALQVLETEARKVMPQGYTIDYAGESRQLRVEGSKFLPALGLALMLIFLVLAAQFNSFRDPLVILLGSAPLAMFGAMIFTALRAPGDPSTPHWNWGWTTSWNIYSQVGLITLIGLVAKNGILVVEFANSLQEQGRSKLAAVREAASTRLRPILMTTAATVFGHLMLVFVTGAGAAARNSIGLVLVCGMTIGTFFTLFIIPSLYVLIAKDHSREHLHVPVPAPGAEPALAK